MTHDFRRGKLPFKVTGSSVNTGYQEILSSRFKPNTDIVNLHNDTYSGLTDVPIQSPFTQEHVGGNQHRHVPINSGADNDTSRPESFKLLIESGSIKIYGPDATDVNNPRAQMFKGAKSPINIQNIQNTNKVFGNFRSNYEVVQTVGRRTTNNLINDNFTASSDLTTQFLNGLSDYSLPDISNNSKSIFVERFSSPGSKEESSRRSLDREGEEYSPNNVLTTRNIKIRQPYYNQLTKHSPQFGSSSLDGISEHGINRNRLVRLEYSGSSVISASDYDNFWVQHAIPRSDLGYLWITQSVQQYKAIGYQTDSTDIEFNRTLNYRLSGDISLTTQTLSTSLSASDYTYSTWKQVRGNEHPVSVRLRNNNLLAVQDPVQTKKLVFSNNTFINVTSKRAQSSTIYREPPVTNKYKPLEQDFKLKTDTQKNTGHKLKYTFANNDSAFANKELNQKLGLIFNRIGLYENILDSQNKNITPEEQNPFKKLFGITYKEVIYPREENTYLSGSRSRNYYLLDESGFSRDGYDIQLGTQRTFWRSELADRKRSKLSNGGYYNSLNYSSLDETGTNFSGHTDSGVLTDNKFITIVSSLVISSSINSGILNSLKTLESGTNERQIYTYTSSITAENIAGSGYYLKEVYNNIIKRGYVYDVSGEWNNLYNDFYEEIKNNSETTKRGIGATYRNTSFKSLLTSLPEDRSTYTDLAARTEDEEVFVNPRPKYVTFIGGVELNTGSYVQNASNFSNLYQFPLSSIDGYVYSIAPSGNNSIYVGGEFTNIDGNINGSGIAVWNTVSSKWYPLTGSGINGTVYSIVVSGNILYIGGDFASASSTSNTANIAKYNTTNGTWSSLGTSLNGAVRKLLLSGNILYIGGEFTNANGIADADLIVKYNTSTSAWSAVGTNSLSSSDSAVYAIALSGTDVYAGGIFTGIPNSHNISINTGGTSNWKGLDNTDLTGSVYALAVSGTKLYVGGDFISASNIDSASYLAVWNTIDETWDSASYDYPNNTVYDLLFSGSDLYVAGNFETLLPNDNGYDYFGINHIAKLNVNNEPDWSALDKGANDAVYSVALKNEKLYIGGKFTQIGNTKYTLYIGEWSTSTLSWKNLLSDIQEAIFTENYFLQSFNYGDFSFSTLDNGLQKSYFTNLQQQPAYDSYELYLDDVRGISKDYSIIPEFKISDHIKYYVSSSGGNFRAKNNAFLVLDGLGDDYRSSTTEQADYNVEYFRRYSTSDILTKSKKIEKDYSNDLKISKLSLICKGIKKLLPYNGFYPQERTTQLANLYSEYVENNLHGGVYSLYNFNDYLNKNIVPSTNASSLAVTKAFNKYYMAVGLPSDSTYGRVRVYSTYDDTESNWNSVSYVTISPVGATNPDTKFGQSLKILSASNGLNLFISSIYSASNANGHIYLSTSSNGTTWSTPQLVASGPSSGSQFGYYMDAAYDIVAGTERAIIATGAPNYGSVTYPNRGATYEYYSTLNVATKQWSSWTANSQVYPASVTYNNYKYGTGISLLSCSLGYQLYTTSPGNSGGKIQTIASSNGTTWPTGTPSPTNIANSNTANSGIGLNNLKAVNYNNKTYLFFSEPYLTVGSATNAGKVYVISSSANNAWSTTASVKTELYTGSITSDYVLNADRSYSIEAGAGGGKLFYAFADANRAGSSTEARILLGETSDGLTWKKNLDMLVIPNSVGANTITSARHTVYSTDLPVFFSTLGDPLGIYAVKNNILTQYSVKVSDAEKYYKQAALEPIMSPGILYNTIKSGIAVDWPCATGSQTSIQPYGNKTIVNAYYPKAFKMAEFNGSVVYQSAYGLLRSNIDYRIPFENLLFPDEAFEPKEYLQEDLLTTTQLTALSDSEPVAQFLDKCYIYGGYEPYISPVDFGDTNNLGAKRYAVPFVYRKKNSKNNGLYTLAMSNFLAETIKFFLKDEKLVTFTSQPDYKWKQFKSGKTYYMDVVLEKSSELVMMEAYHNSLHPTGAYGEKMNGRYFGYPVNKTNKDIWTGTDFTAEEAKLIHNDPAYAPYTPPYFEGTARARISFTPTSSKKYTLEEILERSIVEDVFIDLQKSAHTDSDAYINKMPIGSSIDLFGEAQSVNVKITTGKSQKEVTENLGSKIWIISPKMETPVLNFSDQNLLSYINSYSKTSGFGRGMWSGKGNIPNAGTGIKLRLEYPYGRLSKKSLNTTGSLLEQVGFKAEEKTVGKIADNKLISEAIVAIPYLEEENLQTIKNVTGFNFISIDKNIFDIQKNNIENGESAVKANQIKGLTNDVISTTISDMINKMKKYVIPPELNFLQYTDIKPFVMYIFEFEHTLSQNDLANIWQGYMPEIAYNAQKDEIKIEHRMEKYEFFGGAKLPENLKWLVFRVKRRAEINYFNVTANTKDDERFNFNKIIGRAEGTDVYSYNWPYDYFSLVELAKIEAKLDYEGEDK